MITGGSLLKRRFASDLRTVCILANSRQADLIGSKIIENLQREAEGKAELQFVGYGGPRMKQAGFDPTVEVDIDQFPDKTFTTYRKTKTASEALYMRWNPFNLVNKHFTRQTNDLHEAVSCSTPLPYPVSDLSLSRAIAYHPRAAQEDLLESA